MDNGNPITNLTGADNESNQEKNKQYETGQVNRNTHDSTQANSLSNTQTPTQSSNKNSPQPTLSPSKPNINTPQPAANKSLNTSNYQNTKQPARQMGQEQADQTENSQVNQTQSADGFLPQSKPVEPPAGTPGLDKNIQKQPGNLPTKPETYDKSNLPTYPPVSQSVKPTGQPEAVQPQSAVSNQTSDPNQANTINNQVNQQIPDLQQADQLQNQGQQIPNHVQKSPNDNQNVQNQQQTEVPGDTNVKPVSGMSTGNQNNLAQNKPAEQSQPETSPSQKANEDLKKTHEPVIILPDRLEAGQVVKVKVKVGMIPHVMESSHYIESLELFSGNQSFGKVDLEPKDNSSAETDFQVPLNASMQLRAVAYCNVHGKWESNTSV